MFFTNYNKLRYDLAISPFEMKNAFLVPKMLGDGGFLESSCLLCVVVGVNSKNSDFMKLWFIACVHMFVLLTQTACS